MGTIFRKELKRTRFGLVIWSSIVGILALFAMLEYPVVSQYTEVIGDALAVIPRIGQLIFGVYNVNLNEPIGYYIVMYYWTGLVVFTHSIYTGASIIAKESRDKTVEFTFTKPYKRRVIVWAKIYTALVNIAAIGIVAIIMSIAGMIAITDNPAVYIQIIISGFGMLFTQCVLMSLGLLCSAIFKTYKSSVKAAAVILLASYCLMFFIQYVDMPSLNFLSPLTYFSVSDVVENGFGILYIVIFVGLISICALCTQKIYSQKEMVA